MSLNAYRIQIDKIDDQLLELLERRKLITKMVQKIKKKKGLDLEDTERENAILERLTNKSKKLKREDLEQLYQPLFTISKKI
jgi:chorismate mutase